MTGSDKNWVWRRGRSSAWWVGDADSIQDGAGWGWRKKAGKPGASPQGFRRTGHSREVSHSRESIAGLHELQGSWEFLRETEEMFLKQQGCSTHFQTLR